MLIFQRKIELLFSKSGFSTQNKPHKMLRTRSQIAKQEKYLKSRAKIVDKYSNGYEDMICISPLSLHITGEDFEPRPMEVLGTCPWDNVISVSPLARNALCPEPIGTKKVGLRKIGASFKKGKAYYTAASEEETFFGISKSWVDWKRFSGDVESGMPWIMKKEHLLWTISQAWLADPINYRMRVRVGRILTPEFFCESVARLKLFLRFVNYNFQWTTEHFNAKHDEFHASMLTLCNEIDEFNGTLEEYAIAHQLANPAFLKNLKTISLQASLFRQKYQEYSSLRIVALNNMLVGFAIDDNVSSTILGYLY